MTNLDAILYTNMPMTDTPTPRDLHIQRYQALVRQYNAATDATERGIAELMLKAQEIGMRHCGFTQAELNTLAKGE